MTPMVVPFVALWSDEAREGVARIIRWRGHPAIFTNRQTGVPDFGATNSHRQRRCMDDGLCQVCGTKGATLYVIVDDSATVQTHVGLWDEHRHIINAPLHRQCYEYALSVCPSLRKVKPYAIHDNEGHRPLPVVAFSNGTMVLPLDFHPALAGIAREAVVELRRE